MSEPRHVRYVPDGDDRCIRVTGRTSAEAVRRAGEIMDRQAWVRWHEQQRAAADEQRGQAAPSEER